MKLEASKNQPVMKGKVHSWSVNWHNRPMKEDISERLRRAGETGKRNREQADEKLEAIKNKPVMKGKGHSWSGHWHKRPR